MDFDIIISRINTLCSQKNINRTKALTDSGVGKDFVTNMQKGSKPSVEKIQQLAAYFNVSTDYLLGNDTSKAEDPATDDQIKFALLGTTEVDDTVWEDIKTVVRTMYEVKNKRDKK